MWRSRAGRARLKRRHPPDGLGRLVLRQLEAGEAVERRLDLPVCAAAPALPDPMPGLDQELARLPVGLEVERRHDLVAAEHRQGEIAELALRLRQIGLEQVLVAEEGRRALALDDERVEGRQDVGEGGRRDLRFQRLRPRPVRRLRRRRRSPAPAAWRLTSRSMSALTAGFALASPSADRIEADDALRAAAPAPAGSA